MIIISEKKKNLKKSSNHHYFGLCFFSRESILSAQCEYDDFCIFFRDFRCLHDCSEFFFSVKDYSIK